MDKLKALIGKVVWNKQIEKFLVPRSGPLFSIHAKISRSIDTMSVPESRIELLVDIQ
jgi:hypothetical protein